jgi:hypothetical protein
MVEKVNGWNPSFDAASLRYLPVSFIRVRRCVVALTVVLAGAVQTALAFEAETAAEVLAAHVREQGHPCEMPVNAVRDRRTSKPDEAAWTLRCANASYSVRLTADQRAHVERLGQ